MKTESQTVISPVRVSMALRPRRLIHVISLIVAVVAVVIVLNILEQRWPYASILIGLELLLGLSLRFVRQDRLTLSAQFTVVSLTVSMGLLCFLFGGIHDAAINTFPVILIFASMFVSRRFFWGILTLILVIPVCIVVANISHWHASMVEPVTWSTLATMLAILVCAAYFTWQISDDLQRALQKLETENCRINEALIHIDALANNDALTGLPNRLLVRSRFDQALELAQRSGENVALLFLDLDHFKTVNDSLGHGAGDALIIEVGRRLRQAVRASDTVSRQGGDEFLIVAAGQPDQISVATLAAKVVNALAAPFQINGVEISSTCSVGVAIYPENGRDFEALLKHADMAMYRAKESGRNTFRFYDAEMNTNMIEHLHLISGIRAALLNNEFTLHYQPQLDLKSSRICGAEALIRWHSPTQGNIPPDRFIPVAERSGQIHEIGAWVLREACRQTRAWQQAGLTDLVVGINLSPVQFRRDDLEREILDGLDSAGLAATSIELELTESLLIVDSDRVRNLLHRIHALGVHLSIDDFGTGYSNLGYLTRFEVERLKIDQSFIRHLTENDNDHSIVRAIIEMAHSLNLQVVAEGVETAAVLACLQQLGCDLGQGFLWSKALPPDQFFQFVNDWNQKNSRASPLSVPDLPVLVCNRA